MLSFCEKNSIFLLLESKINGCFQKKAQGGSKFELNSILFTATTSQNVGGIKNLVGENKKVMA